MVVFTLESGSAVFGSVIDQVISYQEFFVVGED